MSRLAALKEFTFMKALKENGFPVPEPIAQSRHTIVMELIDAFPLRQITEVPDPAGLYSELIDMILRLAGVGLIHGDFNEFNILIREEKSTKDERTSKDEKTLKEQRISEEERATEEGRTQLPTAIERDISDNVTSPSASSTILVPILIDFPQMISTDHANATMYFDRDVKCIKRFFERRFHFTSDIPGPFFADAKKLVARNGVKRLDVEAEASGFSRKMAKELEAYMREIGVDGDGVVGHQDGEAQSPDDGECLEVDDETRDEDEELNLAVKRNLDVAHQSKVYSNTEALDRLSINDMT